MSEPAPLPDTDDAPNDPTETLYEGSVHAFEATGNFTMERGFDTIKLAEQTAPVYVDVTNAVQVTMDVATFNAKLDLTSFDPVTNLLRELPVLLRFFPLENIPLCILISRATLPTILELPVDSRLCSLLPLSLLLTKKTFLTALRSLLS